MEITNTECIATEGAYIARKGTESYFTRCTLLPGETADSFVEVTEIPQSIDQSEYIKRVQGKIHERYSLDDEMGLIRQKDTKPEEFGEYSAYCEECKRSVKLEMEEESKKKQVDMEELIPATKKEPTSKASKINFFK